MVRYLEYTRFGVQPPVKGICIIRFDSFQSQQVVPKREEPGRAT